MLVNSIDVPMSRSGMMVTRVFHHGTTPIHRWMTTMELLVDKPSAEWKQGTREAMLGPGSRGTHTSTLVPTSFGESRLLFPRIPRNSFHPTTMIGCSISSNRNRFMHHFYWSSFHRWLIEGQRAGRVRPKEERRERRSLGGLREHCNQGEGKTSPKIEREELGLKVGKERHGEGKGCP